MSWAIEVTVVHVATVDGAGEPLTVESREAAEAVVREWQADADARLNAPGFRISYRVVPHEEPTGP